MSEWKEKTIGELSIRVSSGLTPLKSNKEFWENPIIPWLKTDQLGEKYIFDTNTKISKEALEQTSLRIYPENTISIAMYGEGKTRGNLSIIKAPITTNQACCNIELDSKLADVEYVYYYLKTQYDALRKLSSGVRKNLNSNDIKNYKIYIPESVRFQRSIVKILTSLDNKISVNNQINQELEAMAKTLYDYWFVQFDFPDQNGKPYKSSGGKMVYHPELKREIPEGWGVESVGNLLDKVTKAEKIENNSIEFVGRIPVIDQSQKYIAGFTNNQNSLIQPQNGHIIFGDHTRVVKFINFDYARGADGTQVLISNNENISNILLYHMIEDFDLSNYGYARHFKFLKEKLVIVPDKKISLQFANKADVIYKKVRNNIFENQQLTQLRDWLLPMLMNGQVKVE